MATPLGNEGRRRVKTRLGLCNGVQNIAKMLASISCGEKRAETCERLECCSIGVPASQWIRVALG